MEFQNCALSNPLVGDCFPVSYLLDYHGCVRNIENLRIRKFSQEFAVAAKAVVADNLVLRPVFLPVKWNRDPFPFKRGEFLQHA